LVHTKIIPNYYSLLLPSEVLQIAFSLASSRSCLYYAAMKLPTLQAEIEKLQRWDDAYYNGTPLVNDVTYDKERDLILARIRLESPKHPYLSQVGAPTGDGGVWPKFKHTTVMGSLFKVNTAEEFEKWSEKKGSNYILTEKADGCTMVAYYEDGLLTNLVTRGDGEIGEDITGNAKYFQNLKFDLPGFTGILRGEAIIMLDAFQKHLAPLGMANPRNAVSGKVRDTSNPELKRHVTIQWFDVICDEDLPSWEKKFRFIEKLGLKVIPYHSNIDAKKVWDVYTDYVKSKRAALNYWIDGLVVRINSTHQHDSLGITDNRPKGSIAIKFPANGVQTTLVAFEISRGLSGRFAPVGIIDPVLIDGTTVTRVSMHGPDWIEAMGLAVGDTVEVAKAGDIIPQITQKIAEGAKRTKIVFPKNCPLCGVLLVRNGSYIECQNKDCIGETYGAIAKWLQKVDIKGIGDSILAELIKDVKDIDELYEADVSVFTKATGGSQKTGKKIWKELHSKKEISLAVFLSALHVSSLGSTNGQRLASYFKTLDKVLSASEDDIRKIPGIAENASKIVEGIKRKKATINKLRKLLDIQEIKQGIFTGQSFCITGKCSKPRNEIEDWIKSLGGVVKGVDRGLTYLITDDPSSGSAKNQKADKYGVKKITEQDLYAMGKVATSVAPQTQEPVHKLVVKLGKTASLFDAIVSHNAGWIELQKENAKKYKIINCSFKNSDQRLGYIHWDDEVEDLDDGVSPQSRGKGISSHLQWNGVSLTEESVAGATLEDIKQALMHTSMTVWEEAEL